MSMVLTKSMAHGGLHLMEHILLFLVNRKAHIHGVRFV